MHKHQLALWVVVIPAEESNRAVRLTTNGAKEAAAKTLKWRKATDVVANFRDRSWTAYADALTYLMSECETL